MTRMRACEVLEKEPNQDCQAKKDEAYAEELRWARHNNSTFDITPVLIISRLPATA